MMSQLSSGNDENTKLLLHFDGNLTDSSASNVQMVYPNVGFYSTSVKKFGSASLINYMSEYHINGHLPNSIFATLLGSDFTIDYWISRRSTGAESGTIFSFQCSEYTGVASLSVDYYVNADGSGTMNVNGYNESNSRVLYIKNIPINIGYNSFTHFAFVRYSNILWIYQDGVLIKSGTMNYAAHTGYTYNFISLYSDFLIDEFRVSDIARWTENFTPPTAPYA